jgi:hypothetical protein
MSLKKLCFVSAISHFEAHVSFIQFSLLCLYLASPYRPVYECEDCDRSFGSQQALDHISIPQPYVFECDECGWPVRSLQALDRPHLNSPAHVGHCRLRKRAIKR